MSDIDTELAELEQELVEPTDDTDDGPDLRVRWRGQVVEIRMKDLTGLDYAMFRQATGQHLQEAMAARGLDGVAGVTWRMLARTNPKLKFSTVAAAITWDSIVDDDEEG